jgi:UDP-2,3-diacylglucosamine pyrophosphatase LpxH
VTTAAAGRRRAVFLSDLHLGAKHCHAAELADFLTELECERLYLVGDIVDLWWMTSRRAQWGPAENGCMRCAVRVLKSFISPAIMIGRSGTCADS